MDTTLRQALTDAERELEQVQIDRDEALARFTDKAERLKEEIRGLRLAIARHNGHTPPEPEPQEQEDWTGKKRTDAVYEVLLRSHQPLGPSSIAAALKKLGRDDTTHWVSATLAYLKKNGRVEPKAPGKWSAIKGGDAAG